MRSKTILYIVLLLFSTSLVSAVDLSTDKTDYNSSEIVTANITGCVGTSITKFLNPGGTLVDIKSGQSNWTTTYQTSSNPASGKYTVSTSCSNGLAEANFCVNDPGCLVEEEEEECIPEWDCREWSSCGIDQLERRTCTDKKNCEIDKEETKACSACQESWTCLSWSTCQNGIQTRTCYDQNNCGTALDKPAGQQSCQELVSEQPITPAKPAAEEESFFAKNKGLIIAVALAVILLVLGLLYFFKWKGKEASFAEVKEWMGSEREKGTSDEDLRIALQKRGWEEKDIKAAFKKLK
ncbi:MAG: hypothetical protein Q8R47_05285 [Nanoarchaeota archaeon]|nr:hypothetical protein [Nanoarchaeota archaeon]